MILQMELLIIIITTKYIPTGLIFYSKYLKQL